MTTGYPLRAGRMLAVLRQVGGLSDQRLQAAAHHRRSLSTRVRRVQPETGPLEGADFGRRFGVLADLVEQLVDQIPRAGDPHPVEIDQLALDSVGGRTPPVLRYGKRRVGR